MIEYMCASYSVRTRADQLSTPSNLIIKTTSSEMVPARLAPATKTSLLPAPLLASPQHNLPLHPDRLEKRPVMTDHQ